MAFMSNFYLLISVKRSSSGSFSRVFDGTSTLVSRICSLSSNLPALFLIEVSYPQSEEECLMVRHPAHSPAKKPKNRQRFAIL